MSVADVFYESTTIYYITSRVSAPVKLGIFAAIPLTQPEYRLGKAKIDCDHPWRAYGANLD